MSFVIYTFFAIPFVVECPFILSIWLDDVPEYAVLFVRLVLIRQMVTQLMVTIETCINATGKIRRFTISTTIIWIAPLLISYFLYKNEFPIETIYWLLIITAFIRIGNALCFCKILCGLNPMTYISRTFTPCLVSALMLGVILYIETLLIEPSWYRLLYSAFSTLILYPTMVFYITFRIKEKRIVTGMISKVKSIILKK